MSAYILVGLAILAYALHRYFKNHLGYFEKSRIPHTPGWPLLGNMANFCLGRQHINDIVRDLYNVHPEAKYVGAFNFVSPTIVLRDLELIKSVTIRHFDRFCDRPLTIDCSADPIFGGNLFTMPGDRWRLSKSLLSPAFTGSKMKAMHELVLECADSFVRHLDELPDKRRVDTKDLFSRVSNDAIVSCAFGLSTDSLGNRDNEIYALGREATRLSGAPLAKLLLFGVFPRLMNRLRVRMVKKSTADFFVGLTEAIVREREARGTVRPDVLQLMMNARAAGKSEVELDAANMTALAFAIYFGGLDTTSTQMCLLAHELAVHPRVQRKLQAEVDEVMRRSEGRPSYEDIQGMPYLDACFNESTRLHALLPFLERKCVKPLELPPTLPGRKPFTVEPGTLVWVPAPAVNRDPRYYDKPDEFAPERYRGRKLSEAPNLSFGMGPRACLGERFAALETKILMTRLLSRFDLMPTDETRSPLVYDASSLTVGPVGGFFLRFEPRER